MVHNAGEYGTNTRARMGPVIRGNRIHHWLGGRYNNNNDTPTRIHFCRTNTKLHFHLLKKKLYTIKGYTSIAKRIHCQNKSFQSVGLWCSTGCTLHYIVYDSFSQPVLFSMNTSRFSKCFIFDNNAESGRLSVGSRFAGNAFSPKCIIIVL